MTLKPLPPWQHNLVGGDGTGTKEFYDYLLSLDRLVRAKPVTFANLPSPAAEGMTAPIIDSTVNTWGSIIAGGGGNHVLGYYDGANWTVAAK